MAGGRAEDLRTALEHAFAAEVAVLGDADLDEMRPTHWGASLSVGTLAWSIGTEHLHHGAEIGVLRDLRRGSARSDWWPDIEAARSGKER